MILSIYTSPLRAYRARGAHHLRRARWLATPAPTGRPRKGETRKARPHDVAPAIRAALRLSRYWYACASRYARLSKVPRPTVEK